MATIIQNKNELYEKYKFYRTINYGFLLLILGTLLYIYTYSYNRSAIINYFPYLYVSIDRFGFVFIGFFIELSIYKLFRDKFNSIKSGVKGERNVISIISKLPEDYKAISNVIVEYEGKSSELDLVLIGKNGIFVIETKNHNGTIEGDDTDERWIQYKVGRKGGRYSKSMYNPMKQVSTHVYRLSNFLKMNGVNVWVQGIVFFSNRSARVYINHRLNKIPVFAASNYGVEDLLQYINTYQTKKEIDTETIHKMVSLLDNQ